MVFKQFIAIARTITAVTTTVVWLSVNFVLNCAKSYFLAVETKKKLQVSVAGCCARSSHYRVSSSVSSFLF